MNTAHETIDNINHPELSFEGKEDFIESLTGQFPYCKNLQILLAKIYQQNNSVKFANQLKIAALYSSNRVNLYNLLNKKNKDFKAIIPSDPEILKVEEIKPVLDNVQEVFFSDKLQNILGTKINLPAKNLSQKTDSLDDFIHEELKNIHVENISAVPKAKEIEAFEAPKEIDAQIESLAGDILESDITKAIEIPVEESKVIDVPVKQEEEINEPVARVEAENLSSNKVSETKAFSFLDWLNNNNIKQIEPRETIVKSSSPEEIIDTVIGIELPIAKEIKEEIVQEEKEALPLKDPFDVVVDKPKTSENIVDKFILEQPRIKPGRVTFYKAADKAKESITENKDLITETLVLIYAKQGNYRKAIQGYERLSLKFPEKSAYFASQIEKIKDYLIKNNIKY